MPKHPGKKKKSPVPIEKPETKKFTGGRKQFIVKTRKAGKITGTIK